MNNKINLLILFGGVSSEHDISRLSTASVLNNINKDAYNITKVGITKDGRWILTDASADEIYTGSWETLKGNKPAIISPDRKVHGLVIEEPDGKLSKKYIDVVFPVMHGQNAEDGTMQGFLQIAGLPCVGAGTASSAACMDKAVTKSMMKQHGSVAQADFYVSHKNMYDADKHGEIELIDKYFAGNYPVFVKPANAGSSVGITKAKSYEELENSLDIAFAIDNKVLIEEAIVGREIEVAVLGNESIEISCLGEIFSANEFYDFNAKYENESSKTGFVHDLPKATEDAIKDAAATVYNVMGCKGMARVDFFLEEDGRVVLNELNTIPGFTKISMYPQLWCESGLSYDKLIDKLIRLALDNKPRM